ncbi:MAG: hypothetical protein INR70_27935 [Parafilimonas terrae]|nr:hypothetical protein [Parafilimonas terrae]
MLAWRDKFANSVGMAKYRRAAGFAVDEVAKAAVLNIRRQFSTHLKRQTPWTKSAVVYKRLSKADLNGLERGERHAEDVYAQVYVKPNQSVYLKYLFGLGDNTRLPGDVGLARDHILIPWWQNITETQGVVPTANGGVPTGFVARLFREAQGDRSPKKSGTQSRWGVYYGAIKIHGQPRLAYVARPPRVPVTSRDIMEGRAQALDATIVTRDGTVRRVGRKLRDIDHPRVLFLSVDKATYKPKLQKPWDDACLATASVFGATMEAQLADNILHKSLKSGFLR